MLNSSGYSCGQCDSVAGWSACCYNCEHSHLDFKVIFARAMSGEIGNGRYTSRRGTIYLGSERALL